MYRIGQGIDFHQFTENRALIIGGITIPHTHGLLGHSDADVLVHSIMDALLGALALGDIGQHFPDTDPAYRGIDSSDLLGRVIKMVQRAGYYLVNCDATIIAQQPRMAPHIPAMQIKLAHICQSQPHQISIKATTTEYMGSIGRKEGIAAMSILLLTKGNHGTMAD